MAKQTSKLPFVVLWRLYVAMDPKLSSSAKTVADKLSFFMDADGKNAYPAVWKLVHLTSLSERTVRSVLDDLVAHYWLTESQRDNLGGRQTSKNYDARLPAGIVDDGRNPLHDEAFWAVAFVDYEAKNRPKKGRTERLSPATTAGLTDASPATTAGLREISPATDVHLALQPLQISPATIAPRSIPEVSQGSSSAESTTTTQELLDFIDEACFLAAKRKADKRGTGPQARAYYLKIGREDYGDELRELHAKFPTLTSEELVDKKLFAAFGWSVGNGFVGGPGATADQKLCSVPTCRRFDPRKLEPTERAPNPTSRCYFDYSYGCDYDPASLAAETDYALDEYEAVGSP